MQLNTPKSLVDHATYMDEAFADDLTPIINSFLDRAADFNPDTLVGTGLSGALVVPVIARALGLKWAIVRKNDGSHSGRRVEGELGHRWMFVDDFVSSGTTLARVKVEVNARLDDWNTGRLSSLRYYATSDYASREDKDAYWNFKPFESKYVGTYEYSRGGMYDN